MWSFGGSVSTSDHFSAFLWSVGPCGFVFFCRCLCVFCLFFLWLFCGFLGVFWGFFWGCCYKFCICIFGAFSNLHNKCGWLFLNNQVLPGLSLYVRMVFTLKRNMPPNVLNLSIATCCRNFFKVGWWWFNFSTIMALEPPHFKHSL